MMKMLTLAVITAAALALPACSLLPRPEPQTRHMLSPIPATAGVEATTRVSRTIKVTRPSVPVAFQENRLPLVRGTSITYYEGQGWDAPLADMLEAATARDLATLLPGRAIVSENSGVKSDQELQMDVRNFSTMQQGDAAGPANVVMDIDVRLVDPTTRRVLRNLPYRFTKALPALTTQDTLAAYNEGWSAFVDQTATMVAGPQK